MQVEARGDDVFEVEADELVGEEGGGWEELRVEVRGEFIEEDWPALDGFFLEELFGLLGAVVWAGFGDAPPPSFNPLRSNQPPRQHNIILVVILLTLNNIFLGIRNSPEFNFMELHIWKSELPLMIPIPPRNEVIFLFPTEEFFKLFFVDSSEIRTDLLQHHLQLSEQFTAE